METVDVDEAFPVTVWRFVVDAVAVDWAVVKTIDVDVAFQFLSEPLSSMQLL